MVGNLDRPATSLGWFGSWWVAVAWSVAFLLLAGCVALGLTDGLDRQVFATARPRDEWGPGQLRWSIVVDAFRPPVVAAVLAIVAVSVCVARRSMRSAVVPAASVMIAAGTTLVVKLAMARPDPHLTGSGDGGSFPSGHTVSVVVGVGLAVDLIRPRAGRLAAVAAAAAGAVMGVALVVIGAHWATDVLGGLLLGLAVVCAPTAAGPRRGEAAGDLPGRDQVTGRPVSQPKERLRVRQREPGGSGDFGAKAK